MSALRATLSFLLIAMVAACGDNANVPPVPQCSDGVDNDGDGAADFPADPGCTDLEDNDEAGGTTLPKCNDGQDNDGDGKTDFPNDPGCFDAFADDETDDCPSGPNCPACSDGQDDDENGVIDYPDDPGCSSAGDDSEFLDQPDACGQGLMIKQLPPSGTDTGMLTTASTSQLTTTCGGGAGAPAVAYLFILSEPKVVIASTDNPTTTADTVLDLRSVMCSDPSAHIACSDNVSTANSRSTLTQSLQPGSYYLIVEGKNATATGDYELNVEFFQGEGEACAADPDCGPGLVCRIPVNGSAMVCADPVCSDGLDDDGDGKIDFPADPGCTAATDATEDDDCPNGANCPQCANTLDDDGDGQADYPNDTACTAASNARESCPQTEEIIVATQAITTGTTAGATNDFTPPIGSYNGHSCTSTTTASVNAPDVAIQVDLPATTSLSLRVTASSGYNASHSLLPASCGGLPIDCSNTDNMVLTNVAAGRYYVVVDSFSNTSGNFTFTVSGSIKNGESCEAPLAQAGALMCGDGYACKGTVGSRTCQPAACNDDVDNNSDSKTDYPDDPGCDSLSDDTEETVCPGPACPVCSDGLDNDTDGDIDYPADDGCLAASADNEGCSGEVDPIVHLTTGSISDTLVGASDNHDPSCVGTNFADKIFTIDMPTMQELIIDTEDSVVNTVLSLMTSACTEPALACDDDGGVGSLDSKIVRNFVAAGRYTIAVDSDSSSLNTFNLNVSGTIVPGASCEGALAQAGAFKCGTGFACRGALGSRTCQPSECLDGLDNNGDGKIDFPSDPGCSGPSDGDEDTVCPGPSCPQCSDGADNDGDGDIDYPADDSCSTAASDTEGCLQSEPIGEITQKVTVGDTTGAVNDSFPVCGSTTHSAPDLAYELQIPMQLDSLSLEMGGGLLAAHSLFQGTCSGAPVACSDPSLLTVSNVAPGTYYVVVDGSSTDIDDFTLTTTGTIASGESCEGPLVADGAFTCAAGFACTGAVGSRTCIPASCNDGVDNNGDGTIDYPDDPGCASPSDDVEDTVCPGPNCPECSDGVDNDSDTQIDYTVDTTCSAASWPDEACGGSDPIVEITSMVTTGTTSVSSGAVHDFTPICATTSTTTPHSAADVFLELNLPRMHSLTLDMTGTTWDQAHSLLSGTCEPAATLECSDPVKMAPVGGLVAGRYYVAVDGWSTGTGAWTLTTTGVVARGESCETPMFQQGAFTCAPGSLCQGPVGLRTCAPTQCTDGIDNNADGLIDYPFDPGCATIEDDVEDTVCPGASCPVCFNGADDDTDTTMDFPADFGCAAAGASTETFCTEETTPATVITAPSTNGTLVSTTALPVSDNYEQSCDSFTGNDIAYALKLPVPVEMLVVDTLGSAVVDTVLSVWDASCTRELWCDQDGAPGVDDRSLIRLVDVAAGNYAIQVDNASTTTSTNNTVKLNVKGTVAPGTACTDALFTSGVLACRTGTTCTAGTCQ